MCLITNRSQVFQEVKIDPMGGSTSQALIDLSYLAYQRDIAGINLCGLVLNINELDQLGALLLTMPWLESLDLSIESEGVNYTPILPSIERLGRLRKLNITNCGIISAALQELTKRGNVEIINPESKLEAVELPPSPPIAEKPVTIAPPARTRVSVLLKIKVVGSQIVISKDKSRLLSVAIIQECTETFFSDGKSKVGRWGAKKQGSIITDVGDSHYPKQRMGRGGKKFSPTIDIGHWHRANPKVGSLK